MKIGNSNGPIRILNDLLYPDYEGNEAENRKGSNYWDPITVEFFQTNETGSISVILLTNGRNPGRTDRRTDKRS